VRQGRTLLTSMASVIAAPAAASGAVVMNSAARRLPRLQRADRAGSRARRLTAAGDRASAAPHRVYCTTGRPCSADASACRITLAMLVSSVRPWRTSCRHRRLTRAPMDHLAWRMSE